MTAAPGRDRPILVTGASTGIGHATAGWLAAEGFRVFGTVRRVEDDARLRECEVEPVRMDVTDPASIDRAREAIERALGGEPLFGLVNNAGVPSGGPIEHLPLDELRRVLEINAIGAVAVTQAFLSDVRRARGRIVMMSSISGRIAAPLVGSYAASKWALEAISDSLRRELRGDGVRVVLVEPGQIDTPIWDRLEEMDVAPYRGTRYEAALERLRRENVASGRRSLPPARVAEVVSRAFRARRPRARYVVLGVADRLRLAVFERLPTAWADRIVAARVGGK